MRSPDPAGTYIGTFLDPRGVIFDPELLYFGPTLGPMGTIWIFAGAAALDR